MAEVHGVRPEGPTAKPADSPRNPASVQVDPTPDAVREARLFVHREVQRLAGPDLADSAALVAAELLANAVQHAKPPISVSISGDRELVRIEVSDADSRPPLRPSQSMTNMTGRGLAMIDAVSRSWGVERDPAGGKVVWAELTDDAEVAAPADPNSADAPLTGWHDDDPVAADRYTVVLGDVPTNLLIAAKAHIDNVVREFSLAAGGEAKRPNAPEHLAALIETVVYGFRDARDAIKRQAMAAAQRGDDRTNLTLHLPLSAADAGEAYLAALDEADGYARAARLLTLETPPAHRLFRHWYVEAVIRQLRQVADGEQPERATPFEECLLAEVERLSKLQRISERAARLQRVTAALSRTRTPEDVAAVVLSEGVNALRASGGGLLVPAPDREHVLVPGAVGYGDALVDALREERLDAPLPAATVLRTGEPIWLESQEERDAQFPALRGFEASTISMCAVPLMVRGRIFGALRFSFDTRRLFDDDERAFVSALAAQTARTLERTEIYAAERQASLNLQRALLPDDTPDIAGWDIATFYSPAGGQEAGGDFYDVIRLPEGKFIAVVGDVMGRGVAAAAAMAQIRTMIRAYAITDADPGVVFGKVDAYFETMNLNQLVTVLYLLIDQNTGRVQVGNAGHLPPILVQDAGATLAPTEVGTPFGVNSFARTVSELFLPPGASLVAVTDGLVERRGEDIDEGIRRLLVRIPSAPCDDAEGMLARITESRLEKDAHDDDVTVLVLCHRPGAGPR